MSLWYISTCARELQPQIRLVTNPLILPDDAIHSALAQRQRLFEQLDQELTGLEWSQRLTRWADQWMGQAFHLAAQKYPILHEVGVLATGGFGREELAPYSDIDLALIPAREGDPETETAIKELFKLIDETFNHRFHVRVGYAFLPRADAAGLHPHLRTSLLDARLIAGDSSPWLRFRKAFWDSFPTADFLIFKLNERATELSRTHTTPLAVQPHLKFGAGGVRSAHAANWIRAALGERMQRPSDALDKVFQVRNALHAITEKAHEVLSYHRRDELAQKWKLDPFSLGTELSEAMSQVHDEFLAAQERISSSRFNLTPHVFAIGREIRIGADATASEAALGVALGTELQLIVPMIPSRPRPEANASEALIALNYGSQVLRQMDRCGALDAFLPELTRTRHLMPRDPAHDFTVMEHTLQALQVLEEEPGDSFFGRIRSALRDTAVLKFAIICHDLGKAIADRPHSESGADLVHEIAARWRLTKEIAEEVSWLVLHHLDLATVIRTRDVELPETAEFVADLVQTRERLDYLTLLTYADVHSVGPGIWTPIQDTFLEFLYSAVLERLEDDSEELPDPAGVRQHLVRQLEPSPEERASLIQFLESMPAHYVLSSEPDRVRRDLARVTAARQKEHTVEFEDDPDNFVSRVTLSALDRPRLLNDILGVLYAFDLSLISLRASTDPRPPAAALDVCTVSFGGRVVPPATQRSVATAMRQVLEQTLTVEQVLRQRGKDPFRKQEVLTYSLIEGHPIIVEVLAPRGRGMAYRISRLIADHGLTIQSARVGQWAGQGSASFYVTSDEGEPVTAHKIREIFDASLG